MTAYSKPHYPLRGVAGGGGPSGHFGDLWVRVATSYLLPTEHVWIDCLGDHIRGLIDAPQPLIGPVRASCGR